jgi:hypothetical protein
VTKDVLDREGVGTSYYEPCSRCVTKVMELEVFDFGVLQSCLEPLWGIKDRVTEIPLALKNDRAITFSLQAQAMFLSRSDSSWNFTQRAE